jgi:hypothetical protein
MAGALAATGGLGSPALGRARPATACWSWRSPTAAGSVAAGSYQPSAGGQRTLAEEWNGSTWTVLSTPSP